MSRPTPRRKHVLVVAPRMPFPFHSGERWILALLKLLSARHDVSLFTFLPSDDPAAVAYGLRLEGSLLKKLHALPAPPQRGEGAPDDCPEAVRPFYSARAREELSRVLREDPPDLVHAHFFETAHLVEMVPPSIPTVFTEHDSSHFWPGGSYLRADARGGEAAARERARRLAHARAVYPRYRALTALSRADARRLEELLGTGPVGVVPLTADAAGLSAPPASAEEASACDLLFVGNYRHYPNEDAALRLCRDILPLLRARRPSITLRLAGAFPTPDVQALAGPGVEVPGALPSLRPSLHGAKVFAAPVRLGSGVKGKVLEAFAAGLPAVVSPEVAAGFEEDEAREAMLVAGPPAAFAEAVERLLADEGLRARLSAKASALARERYDDRRAAEEFEKVYAGLWGGDAPAPAAPAGAGLAERALVVLEAELSRGRAAGRARGTEPIRELYVEATHRCDLRCFMCEHWQIETKDPGSAGRELGVPELEAALASSRLLGAVEQVVVTGGEPWLREDSPRLVAMLARRFPGARLIVLTNLWNGGLLARRLAQLREAGVERVHLGSSLDGLGEAHDAVRGREGAFAGLRRTVDMLRREHPGLGLGFTFTITPRNYRSLEEAFRFAGEELGCDFGAQFVVQTDGIEAIRWPAGAHEAVDRQLDAILARLCARPAARRDIEELLAGGGRPGNRLWRELLFWSRLRRINVGGEDLMDDCLSGRRYAMLDPEGGVFFCPVGRKHVIGSLRQAPFDAIWTSAAAEAERARISTCQCKAWIRCIANPVVDGLLSAAGR